MNKLIRYFNIGEDRNASAKHYLETQKKGVNSQNTYNLVNMNNKKCWMIVDSSMIS